MIDYITLGSSPCDESCAQVGESNYTARSRLEIDQYISQLWRVLSKRDINKTNAPIGFKIVRKSFSHDYGTYYEAAVVYDENHIKGIDLAFWLEENVPTEWDEEAKKVLNEALI